ncbi:hypothetical protein BgiMline_004210 [Biomphalaria glabrata]|nr:hypothetical protein BgiMline_030449 [Biomphalaria glabrata]
MEVEDVRTRIGEAQTAFHQLKNTLVPRDVSTTTMFRLFNTILLYRAEIWRTNVPAMKRYSPMLSLRKILIDLWQDKLPNG